MKKQITTALASLAAFGALAAPQALADSGTIELAPQPDQPTEMAPEPGQLPQPEDPIAGETPPADEPVPTKGDDGQGPKPKVEKGGDEKQDGPFSGTGDGQVSDETCQKTADILNGATGFLNSWFFTFGMPADMAWKALRDLDYIKSRAEAKGCTITDENEKSD